ncbi:DUF397 domain-containing protein [Streptomyces sp. NPDC020707]|uniref:DUF397 domain-containing protein n=1 Tax=Streptomyces ortus TaxID=2867268 RepID=A0ABT3V5T2_9ACTN|nr:MULTISPECIES: DUF397 domain-containing protein [Streptomyces]MCX4233716.1 DUF397 domain-containing protein [Streptomyces ortus]
MTASARQKSSHCGQGDSCLHVAETWQKSSLCQEGEACLHVGVAAKTIRLTESGDPRGAILGASPGAFSALLSVVKGRGRHGA